MLKLISIIKLTFKKNKKRQRPGVEGVNEVEPVIGRGVTLSQPVTGTRLIHLNGHWRPIQTETISILGWVTYRSVQRIPAFFCSQVIYSITHHFWEDIYLSALITCPRTSNGKAFKDILAVSFHIWLGRNGALLFVVMSWIYQQGFSFPDLVKFK